MKAIKKKIAIELTLTEEEEAKLRNLFFASILRRIAEEKILPLLREIPLPELVRKAKKENTEKIWELLWSEKDDSKSL